MRIIGEPFAAGKRRGLFDEPAPDGTTDGGGGGTTPSNTFVPSEEFKAFQATMSQSMQTMAETLTGIRALIASGTKPAVATDVVTDGQFEEAVRNGDAGTIRKYNAQVLQRFENDTVAPLRAVGLEAIVGLTQTTMESTYPLYKRFRKEIDEILATVPVEARANIKAHEHAYRIVVGRHHDELSKEAVQAALRQAAEPGGGAQGTTGAGSRGNGGGKGSDPLPTAAELFGSDQALALQSRGMNEESFAKSLGYASWADYVKLVREQEGATA